MSAELENKKRFANAMFHYARILPYCAPEFKDQSVLAFWFERLSTVDFGSLKVAFDRLVCVSRKFPTISEIEDALGISERDSEDEARLLVANVTTAISKFGYANEEAARSHLGELAWRVVRLNGGWQRVCSVSYDELPILQAQWRHLAENIVRDNRIIGNMEALPESPRNRVNTLIGDLVKRTPSLPPGARQ